jgi:hypothetical protein
VIGVHLCEIALSPCPDAAGTMDVLQMQKWLFLPEPPEDLAPIRNLLRHYSHVPADEVDSHLVRIVSHWPCAFIIVYVLTNSVDG